MLAGDKFDVNQMCVTFNHMIKTVWPKKNSFVSKSPNPTPMRNIILLIVFFQVMTFSTGLAQGVTTSFLGGVIKDKNGTVPGANVVAVHEPTGTTYGTVSDADGKILISNMRVGGPYKVTISFVGYMTQTYEDVYLKLGRPT